MNGAGISGEARAFERKHHFFNVQLAPQDAWMGAALAMAFNFFGMLLQLAIHDIPDLPHWPMIASAGAGAMLFLLHFGFRKTAPLAMSKLFYLLNLCAVVVALAITNPYFAAAPKVWVPFQANKLGCLLAAMIAPGFWVGVISISAHSVGSAIQFLLFAPELKTRVASAEPLASLAFGLAGVLVLIHRFRKVVLEQEVAAIVAKAESDRKLAQAFLMIRDRMNTPLQVIEIALTILRQDCKGDTEVLDQIERASSSLQELNLHLNPTPAPPNAGNP